MKIFFSYIILITLLLSNYNNVYTQENEEKTPYSLESWYKLYQSRVQSICEEYKYYKKDKKNWKINFVIKIPDNYLELNNENKYFLADIKNTHRTNMNNIYKCGLLSTQKKSLILIKNDLIKNTPSIAKKLDWKIKVQINKIDLQIKALKCNFPKDKDSIQKLVILSQATYQTCKYINYLEYLKDYQTNIKNLISYENPKSNTAEDKLEAEKKKDELNNKLSTNYDISEIVSKKTQEIYKLNKEIEHTYKVFPLVFQAYTEYENNITIHFLLNLIKVDYIVLREKLHKALNPINQVVYKISNAMKK